MVAKSIYNQSFIYYKKEYLKKVDKKFFYIKRVLYIAYLFINQKKKTTMKKIMIAFSTALVLAACGNGNGSAATTDSTQAVVDSTAVTANDSTTAQITDSTVKAVEVK